MGETPNERPVKVAKAQKGSNILYFGGRWPVFYSCNFRGIHACYPLFKDYPQVIYGRGMESALLRFEVQVVVLRHCEDVFNGVNMVGKRSGRSDGNIVHVDSNDRSPYRVLCDDIFIDLIHHGLEGCWGVAEAKKHNCGLKESIACFERCFMFIAPFNAYVVVPPAYI